MAYGYDWKTRIEIRRIDTSMYSKDTTSLRLIIGLPSGERRVPTILGRPGKINVKCLRYSHLAGVMQGQIVRN